MRIVQHRKSSIDVSDLPGIRAVAVHLRPPSLFACVSATVCPACTSMEISQIVFGCFAGVQEGWQQVCGRVVCQKLWQQIRHVISRCVLVGTMQHTFHPHTWWYCALASTSGVPDLDLGQHQK